MTLEEFNAASAVEAVALLRACAASERWASALAAGRPYASLSALFDAAAANWRELGPNDWREALSAHPRIGERSAAHADARSREWSAGEQAAVSDAERLALAQANREYEARFGHIFIISASGKGGAEMLFELHRRMKNTADVELAVAGEELGKIARLRLEKLLRVPDERGAAIMSGITTHVLDMSSGAPAFGVRVRLERVDSGTVLWDESTDEDGRVRGQGTLEIEPIRYRLVFDTGAYWRARGITSFFPVTTIEFEVADATRHYHVPMLMSPFGYSTYRGS